MATAVEGPSTSKETGKISIQIPNDALSTSFHEIDTTRASGVSTPREREEDATATTSESSRPVEVKEATLIQKVKAWSPVLVLENSGSVGEFFSSS